MSFSVGSCISSSCVMLHDNDLSIFYFFDEKWFYAGLNFLLPQNFDENYGARPFFVLFPGRARFSLTFQYLARPAGAVILDSTFFTIPWKCTWVINICFVKLICFAWSLIDIFLHRFIFSKIRKKFIIDNVIKTLMKSFVSRS